MNTRFFLCLLAALMGDVADEGDMIEEDGVLLLTGENFLKVTSKFDYVLVRFEASWCVPCKADSASFSQVVSVLGPKTTTIKLAKVDVSTDGHLAEHFEVPDLTIWKFIRF